MKFKLLMKLAPNRFLEGRKKFHLPMILIQHENLFLSHGLGVHEMKISVN